MFCQAHACVMVKPTNIVLDRQKFKCSPNNACSFSRGLRQIFLAVRAEMTKRSTVLLIFVYVKIFLSSTCLCDGQTDRHCA